MLEEGSVDALTGAPPKKSFSPSTHTQKRAPCLHRDLDGTEDKSKRGEEKKRRRSLFSFSRKKITREETEKKGANGMEESSLVPSSEGSPRVRVRPNGGSRRSSPFTRLRDNTHRERGCAKKTPIA